MNTFKNAVFGILKDSAEAVKTFPSAIGCAAGFAFVTLVRIHLEWSQQAPYNFLFNCLHWSFALGALISLPLITYAQSRVNTPKAFKLANFAGVAAAAVTFALLYSFAESDPSLGGYMVASVSATAAARVGAAMFVSILAFIVFAGYPEEKSDFTRAFFMTHKAFFIASLYGGVVLAGASGVAGAIEALLYNDMSSKVYMYISTLSGLLAFTIFVGYFPNFRKDSEDEHRETAQKQPRFIEILFGNILVPIVLALTVVLLIWAGRTIVSGVDTYFNTLYGIAAAYTIGGIWLHIMVTRYESGIAKFYRRIYPVTALVILVFEAWALFLQLGEFGLKFTEYSFGIVWILAAASSILLLIRKERAHHLIVILASVLALVYVLPVLGYNALPVTAQSNRLKDLLSAEGMFVNEEIVPAAQEPELSVRENITDAVEYLSYYTSDAKLPSWFDRNMVQPDVFLNTMGFEKVWPERNDDYPGNTGYLSTMLFLNPAPVDISGYQWAINPQDEYKTGQNKVTLTGEKGVYDIYWETSTQSSAATLRIMENGEVILENDMKEFFDAVMEKYPLGQPEPVSANIEDMSIKVSSERLDVLIVVRYVEVILDPQKDSFTYWIDLAAAYVSEK